MNHEEADYDVDTLWKTNGTYRVNPKTPNNPYKEYGIVRVSGGPSTRFQEFFSNNTTLVAYRFRYDSRVGSWTKISG